MGITYENFLFDSKSDADSFDRPESIVSRRGGYHVKPSLLGQSLIGFNRGAENTDSFSAVNPSTRQQMDPPFFSASQKELDSAFVVEQ
jgi:hypothetical protein